MLTINPAERRKLRATAHALHPVVAVGQHGLTPAVLHEIDVALIAHGLIKVRVFSDDRAERDALLARICDEMGCAPVQHIGKLLIVWRPVPEEEAAPVVRKKAKPSHTPAPKKGGSKPSPKARAGTSRRTPATPATVHVPRSTQRSRELAEESKSDAMRRGDQARRRRRQART